MAFEPHGHFNLAQHHNYLYLEFLGAWNLEAMQMTNTMLEELKEKYPPYTVVQINDMSNWGGATKQAMEWDRAYNHQNIPVKATIIIASSLLMEGMLRDFVQSIDDFDYPIYQVRSLEAALETLVDKGLIPQDQVSEFAQAIAKAKKPGPRT